MEKIIRKEVRQVLEDSVRKLGSKLYFPEGRKDICAVRTEYTLEPEYDRLDAGYIIRKVEAIFMVWKENGRVQNIQIADYPTRKWTDNEDEMLDKDFEDVKKVKNLSISRLVENDGTITVEYKQRFIQCLAINQYNSESYKQKIAAMGLGFA